MTDSFSVINQFQCLQYTVKTKSIYIQQNTFVYAWHKKSDDHIPDFDTILVCEWALCMRYSVSSITIIYLKAILYKYNESEGHFSCYHSLSSSCSTCSVIHIHVCSILALPGLHLLRKGKESIYVVGNPHDMDSNGKTIASYRLRWWRPLTSHTMKVLGLNYAQKKEHTDLVEGWIQKRLNYNLVPYTKVIRFSNSNLNNHSTPTVETGIANYRQGLDW
jgi:hypothetical protein